MTRYRETIVGISSIILSGVLFAATFGIKEFSRTSLGADFVPRVTAIILCLLGITLVVREYRANRAAGPAPAKSGEPAVKPEGMTGPVPVVLNILLFSVYLLLLEKVGFVLLTPFFLFFQILLLTNPKKYRFGWYIVLSVAVSVISYYMFVNFFQVMLPNGLLE